MDNSEKQKADFWLVAPPEWRYELEVLLREHWPFAVIASEKTEGIRGLEIDPRTVPDKNAAKRLLYRTLEMTVPWGILTGVRPSKVAYDHLARSTEPAEVVRLLEEEYLLREDKARLCTEVALHEKALLQDHQGTDVSVYVGVPFCPTRCSYCSFISNDSKAYKKHGSAYVEALVKEIEAASSLVEGRALRSLYMGGGTPTTLSPNELRMVFEALDEAFGLTCFKEITVEAGRPDTITRERLSVLRDYGVERISVNPQSMRQKTLDLIGRRHQAADIEPAFLLARDMGFSTINMDFIVGLPGEDEDDVRYSMETVEKLRPENLTVHTLAIKRSSRLNEQASEGEKLDLTDFRISGDKIDRMLAITAATAQNLSLMPYYMYRQKNMAGNFENVGYSLLGHECLYNIEIMEERQSILGLGAGAVTKLYFPEENRLERIPNVKTAEEYVSRLDEMIDRKVEGGFRL